MGHGFKCSGQFLFHTGERGSGIFKGLGGGLEGIRGVFSEVDRLRDRLGEHRGDVLACG